MRKSVFGLFCFHIVAVVFAQQTEPQNLESMQASPAGSRILSFITEINSEKELNKDWVEETFTPTLVRKISHQGILDFVGQIRANEAQIHLYDANRTEPFVYNLKVRGVKSSNWVVLTFSIENIEPYRIASIGLNVVDEPAKAEKSIYPEDTGGRNSTTSTPQNQALIAKTLESKSSRGRIWISGELGVRLDQYMRDQFEQGFSGAVLVVKDGRKILYKGYGLADREQAIPNRTSTFFDAGSIMKDFTDVAILKLESQGKLSLNDPIKKYLKKIPADKKRITIHQLLHHSSGLKGNHSIHDQIEMNQDEAMNKIFEDPLRFEPGSERQYSNSGFTVLAAIIEKASKKSYLDYITQNILSPAGLEDWAFFGQKERMKRSNVATGYDGIIRDNYNNPYDRNLPKWQILGAGGISFTLEELYKFSEALKSGKILSKDALDKFMNLYNPTSTRSFETPARFFGGGSDVGFTMVSWDLPEENTYVIMASNTANFASPNLADDFVNLLLGREVAKEEVFEPKSIGEWGLPSGDLGNLAMEFLNALCSNNMDTYTQYVTKTYHENFMKGYTLEQHSDFLKQVYGYMKAAPNLKNIRVNAEDRMIEFFIDSPKTGASLKVVLEANPYQKNKIESVSIGQ